MNPPRAIMLKILSVLVFLTMFACIKKTAPDIPAGEAVFFRSFFALVPILGWLVWRGTLRSGLITSQPLGHVWRGLLGTTTMGLGFVGVAYLPFPEAVAIGYTAPLLVTVFAAMFLGEQIRAYRLGAIVLGLIGVMLVLSPRLSMEPDVTTGTLASLGALAALMAAVFAALTQVFVRKLIATESTSAIVFWFTISSTMLSLLTLPFGWALPDPSQTALLVSAGLLGGLGQIILTESYRFAEIAVIAPFEYSSMIFALLIGYFLFNELPSVTMIFGALMVVMAGLIIVWREHRLGIERKRARSLVPPQG